MIGLEELISVEGGGDEFSCLEGLLYSKGCVAEGREVAKRPLGAVVLGKARGVRSRLPWVGDIEGRFFIGDGRLWVEWEDDGLWRSNELRNGFGDDEWEKARRS